MRAYEVLQRVHLGGNPEEIVALRQSILIPQVRGHLPREQCMFATAVEFHEAALRCWQPVEPPGGGSFTPLAPGIANYAMAAELYLKALLVLEGREPPQKHRLDVLFAMLQERTQAAVAVHLKERLDLDRKALLQELQTLGAAFVDWRYIFDTEGRDISVATLVEFARSLYLVSVARQPSWLPDPYLAGRASSEPEDYPAYVHSLGGGMFVRVMGRRET